MVYVEENKNVTLDYKETEERIDYKMMKSNEYRFDRMKPEKDGCERYLDRKLGIIYKEEPKTGQWYKSGFILTE